MPEIWVLVEIVQKVAGMTEFPTGVFKLGSHGPYVTAFLFLQDRFITAGDSMNRHGGYVCRGAFDGMERSLARVSGEIAWVSSMNFWA